MNDARNQYWNAIRSAWDEYEPKIPAAAGPSNHQINIRNFHRYLEDKWGFKVLMDSSGILSDYTITDEAKFNFFRLKYFR